MNDLTTYFPDYWGHITRAENLLAELVQDAYKRPAIVLQHIRGILETPNMELLNSIEDDRELEEISRQLEYGFSEILRQLELARESLRSYPRTGKSLKALEPRKKLR